MVTQTKIFRWYTFLGMPSFSISITLFLLQDLNTLGETKSTIARQEWNHDIKWQYNFRRV